jgi:hypothetical protein
MANAKLGMRSTSTFDVTGERPESWRQGVKYLYPKGALTLVMSNMKGRKTDDPHFHWFTERYRNKAADLQSSGVYTDLGFGTALTATDTAAGSILAARCTSEFASWIRAGHVILLRTTLDHSGDMPVRVVSVVPGSDSVAGFSFVTLKADYGASATATMVTANRGLIIGNAHGEGSNRPASKSYQSTEHGNYTQIFRNSMSITRTAMRTRLRTEEAYFKIKRQCGEDHTIEMEDAFLYGEKTLGEDENGQPLRTTMGIVPFIKTYAEDNFWDYRLDPAFSGLTWDAGGEEFMFDAIEQSFLWGDGDEKLCLLGAGSSKAVQRMVKNNSMYNIYRNEQAYGIKVTKLETPHGVWNLRLSARMTHETSNTNSLIVLEPKNLEYVYVDDTSFEPDVYFGKGGGTGKDGKEEGFITEAGLELHHPETFMYITNLGVTNVA